MPPRDSIHHPHENRMSGGKHHPNGGEQFFELKFRSFVRVGWANNDQLSGAAPYEERSLNLIAVFVVFFQYTASFVC